MNLNKEIWKEANFGHIVENINVHNKEPLSNGINRFISLEHIDSGILQLLRWGDLNTESTTFSKVFKSGDILFGKRRSYLKKVAIADFDGICSSDILVFRSKNGFPPGLIPFIVASDRFIGYAVSTSAGSLSPRTKWKDISNFKFKLPPKDDQEKILSLFLTLEKQIEQTETQEKNLLKTKRQLLWELFSEKQKFGTYLNSENYQTVQFGKLAEHISKRVEPAKTDLKIYVGLEHLDPDNLIIERQGSSADVKGTKLLIWKGDIIFGKRRAYQRKVAVSHFEGICSAHSMVLRAKKKAIKKEFLPYFMQSDVFMDRSVQISEGSLSPTIKWKILEKQEFAIPKMEFQEKLTDLFKHFDKLIYELREQKETLKKLKQKLLDEILG
ncbi:MAG: restriction endonuclease subunit S [Desulfobacteraceae bacterium]|nr:restriction endonuclease subunit S [Desulfobacteraceae bacterium]